MLSLWKWLKTTGNFILRSQRTEWIPAKDAAFKGVIDQFARANEDASGVLVRHAHQSIT